MAPPIADHQFVSPSLRLHISKTEILIYWSRQGRHPGRAMAIVCSYLLMFFFWQRRRSECPVLTMFAPEAKNQCMPPLNHICYIRFSSCRKRGVFNSWSLQTNHRIFLEGLKDAENAPVQHTFVVRCEFAWKCRRRNTDYFMQIINGMPQFKVLQ